MSDGNAWILEILDEHVKAIISGLFEKVSEKSSEESDEVRGLRKEYGTKLLAEQARAEGLEMELKIVSQDRDNAWKQVRRSNQVLQRAYEASRVLHEALYGVGS